MEKANSKVLATACFIVTMICGTVAVVAIDSNRRTEKVEAIRVEKQHELEVTKQKAIEKDKGRKRKIWEREMTPESSK